MSEKVSIITAAYNASKTIYETYLSIKNQSYSDWEWIVINDKSIDNTSQIVEKMQESDKRIILINLKENVGAAIARNEGINVASGRFIAFLDADDTWKPKKLDKQISFMLSNDYCFTYTNYDVVYNNGKIKEYNPRGDSLTYRQLLSRCDIGTLTVIYDSLVLGKRYMPTDCIKREDHGAWLDITREGTTAYKLNENLASYSLTNSSVSSNKFKMIKYQYLLYRNHEKFGRLKAVWYVLLRSLNKVLTKYW